MIHYERDKESKFTGVTYCDLDGYMGFSFCHAGSKKIFTVSEDERAKLLQVKLTKPDLFSKKIGRAIAIGRAEKYKAMVEGEELPPEKAWSVLYSHKMQKKIQGYMCRNMHRFKDEN